MHLFLLLLLIWQTLAQRPVTLIVDFDGLHVQTMSGGGTFWLGSHASLHIGGTPGVDGPMRLSIIDYGTEPNFQLTMDAFDWGVGNVNQPVGTDPKGQGTPRIRKLIPLDAVDITNADLIDINNNADGIIAKIGQAAPFNGRYVEGSADCMHFVQNLIKELYPSKPSVPQFDEWVSSWESYVKSKYIGRPWTKPVTSDLQLVARRVKTWGDSTQNTVDTYKLDAGSETPEFVSHANQQATNKAYQDTASSSDTDDDPIADPWDEQRPSNIYLERQMVKSPFAVVQDDSEICPRSLRSRLRRRCTSSSETAEGTSEMAVARVGGALSSVAVLAESAFVAAGAAAAVLGAAFVILDFVNGNWMGGGFGAAGLALGALVAVTVPGPIGWVIGGLVTALFAILPFLFSHVATVPNVHDNVQIIQWKMFGDASHTGNEQCQKSNPSCQAVYGPGVIALTFGWSTYDAFVFMINYNQGYPMTIPDMANAFQPNGTANAPAVIDCHNGKWVEVSAHSVTAYWQGDNPKFCNHPQFGLVRSLITLPFINQTADKVYDRIIPAPGGDCKLQDSSSNSVFYAEYNITMSGLPVSIACNITATIDNNGVFVPVGAPTPPQGFQTPTISGSASSSSDSTSSSSSPSQTPTLDPGISPASASTNNEPGAAVAPPPPSLFATPFNSTNSVCLSGTTGTLCLPNGTYTQPTGLFNNAFTLTGVDTLTLNPPGSTLTLYTSKSPRDARLAQTVFSSNVSADSSTTLTTSIKDMNADHVATTLDILSPTPTTRNEPPAACLFTKPQYRGDVFCLGIGGADLTAAQVDVAKSVAVTGGAVVWLYALRYGDAGGTRLSASVPDLSTEPYGVGGNFSGVVKAVWVADK